MRREKRKPEDLAVASGAATSTVRTMTGTGRYEAWPTTPECATAQMEHSWLGSLLSSKWTWTAWMNPTSATSNTQIRDETLMNARRCGVCSIRPKTNTPKVESIRTA
jgi:hypothetical protein